MSNCSFRALGCIFIAASVTVAFVAGQLYESNQVAITLYPLAILLGLCAMYFVDMGWKRPASISSSSNSVEGKKE